MEQLVSWLVNERLTYEMAKVRLKERFGVSVGKSCIASFWKRHCEPMILRANLLTNSFLDVRVRVRQGDKILGQTEIAVELRSGHATDAVRAQLLENHPILFDCSTNHCNRHGT